MTQRSVKSQSTNGLCVEIQVRGLGFEPRQTEPKSVVLPLHHPRPERAFPPHFKLQQERDNRSEDLTERRIEVIGGSRIILRLRAVVVADFLPAPPKARNIQRPALTNG